MKNYKKEFIKHLDTIHDIQGDGNSRLTFLTSFGIVTGELADIINYNVEDEGALTEQISEAFAKNEPVSYRDLAISNLESIIKSSGHEIEQKDNTLHLNNVVVTSTNGQKLNFSEFTIFLDNVIGVVKASITEIPQ